MDPFSEPSVRKKDADLVQEVQDEKRKVASAAWWGFDEKDSTLAIQSAIDSGAKTVLIPNMGKDWITAKPVKLASDLEVIFEKGTVLAAMKGKFLSKHESLLDIRDCSNITLRGYGAVCRMRKEDYTMPPYEKAEWRMALAIRGSTNIKVYGLTLRDSGGDGIYIGTTSKQRYCKDIHIKDVTCDNNHRQGISVISAENLLIENTRLLNTGGTPPRAGIDFEPNSAGERLVNCVVRKCVAEGNEGAGILVYLRPLSVESKDVSILFENCIVRNNSTGILVGAIKDDGPGGKIEFRDVIVEGSHGHGAHIYDKSSGRASVRFVRCAWRDNAQTPSSSPLSLFLRRPEMAKRHGGVEFIDCFIEDHENRPFLTAFGGEPAARVEQVTGRFIIRGPSKPWAEISSKHERINLLVHHLRLPADAEDKPSGKTHLNRLWETASFAEAPTKMTFGGVLLSSKYRAAVDVDVPAEALKKAFQVRFRQNWGVLLNAGEELKGRIELRQVSDRRPGEYIITDPDAKVVGQGQLQVGKAEAIRVKAKKDGVYAVSLLTGNNSARVWFENRHVCLLLPRTLWFIYSQPEAFFLPMPDAREIEIGIYTASPGETARVALVDPEGKEVESVETTRTAKAKLKAKVPPEQANLPWSLRVSKAASGFMEDVQVTFKGCQPFLSPHPGRLIVGEK